VVLTGDLTDFGRAAEYEHLAGMLAPLSMPLYLLPGNHDDRDTDAAQLCAPHLPGPGRLPAVHGEPGRAGRLRLVTLDTVDTGASAGRLCQRRLQWLDSTLRKHRGEPIVIAMHHPPFQTLIGHMDRIGLLQGADELAEIVAAHPNVERVICGHLHRTIYTRFAGTVASTAPGPAHQVCLDLADNADSAWTLEPPGFHLHAWTGPGQLVTHVAAIGTFDGPHPFHEHGQLID
jgi:Icc protein